MFMVRRERPRRRAVLTAAVLAAVLALFLMVTSLQFAIHVDGEDVCLLHSRGEAEDYVRMTEEQASGILGSPFRFGDELTIRMRLRLFSALALGTDNPLLAYVDGISRQHVIEVDGIVVGAQPSAEKCAALLNHLAAQEAGRDAVEWKIVNNVQIVDIYARTDLCTDKAVMEEALAPDNTSSPVALKVQAVKEIHTNVSVPFHTRFTEREDLYIGETEVETPGRPGEEIVITRITYENGSYVSSEVAEVRVVSQPVEQVVGRGVTEGVRTDTTGTLIWPTNGIITSYFGGRDVYMGSSYHRGIDIGGVYGQDILAADGGEVICAEYVEGYGNLIQIKHDNGIMTCYGHLSGFNAEVGQRVPQGAVIGYLGDTGTASAPCLHFETRVNGEKVDPLEMLPADVVRT